MGAVVSLPLHLDSLAPRDFQRLAAFIEQACGIRMPPSKKTLVEGRLRRRARALGLECLDDYCQGLFDEGWLEHEAVHIIDAITTNKTEFFREEPHFEVFRRLVTQDLAARSRLVGGQRQFKAWSAACSTGAEPYSIAMVLDDIRQQHPGFGFKVLATDICTSVLEQARAAVFPAEMAMAVPENLRRRYFLRARNPAAGTVRLTPEIRQSAHFGRLNLMDERYPIAGDMDVIFCRNVLIYFDRQRQKAVLERLCRHLKVGGYLFISHTETAAGMDLPLRQVAVAVHQRV